MKKLASFVVLLCVLNVLMIGGLVGYLAGTGRVDKAKVQTIADLLKHQGTPDKLREQVYDLLQPATAPATAPATGPAQPPALAASQAGAPSTADERIDFVNAMIEQERLKLDNDRQALRSAQNSLDALSVEVAKREQVIADREKAIQQQLSKVDSQVDQDNFKKTLELYDEMKPRQIKEIVVLMPEDQAAKYLAAMAPDRVAKIFEEFKTPDEKKVMKELLDRMRGAGTDSASVKGSTASASAASGGM